MKKTAFVWMILGGMVCLEAENLVVASGEMFQSDGMSIEQIRTLYMAKKFRLDNNQRVVLLNLGLDNPMRERFEQDVLGEKRDVLARNWLQAHYQGHHPPKVVKSEQSVAEFLTKMENAIGYLGETTAKKYHLKILYRTDD